MPSFNSVTIIGAGAWGTALAGVAARAGREVTLYARDRAHAAHIASARENPKLPGVALAAGIAVTSDLACAAGADVILVATPAQHLRGAVIASCSVSSQGNARDRLRQGHRARHPQIHDRGDRRSRTPGNARDPVGAELCRRCRARSSDRGDAGGKGRRNCKRSGAGAGVVDLPALSHHRCPRRRDRRRGQERAGDRGRHRGREETRRVGAGRADQPRVFRAHPASAAPAARARRPWRGFPASAI